MPPDSSAECCRYGLITWAIVKTLAALVSSCYILLGIYSLFIEHAVNSNVWLLVVLSVLLVALVVDVCMSITLIVGESKKNYDLVTLYFHYAVYAVITAIVTIVAYTAYELAVLWGVHDNAPWRELRSFRLSDVVKLATVGTIYVLFEVSIVYWLRAEVVSLKNQQKLKCNDVPSETDSFTEA